MADYKETQAALASERCIEQDQIGQEGICVVKLEHIRGANKRGKPHAKKRGKTTITCRKCSTILCMLGLGPALTGVGVGVRHPPEPISVGKVATSVGNIVKFPQ